MCWQLQNYCSRNGAPEGESHVKCHASHVTRHTSHVTRHLYSQRSLQQLLLSIGVVQISIPAMPLQSKLTVKICYKKGENVRKTQVCQCLCEFKMLWTELKEQIQFDLKQSLNESIVMYIHMHVT